MKGFTSPKAIELIAESRCLEEYVSEYEKQRGIDRDNAICPDFILEMLTTAAGLRALADDLEDGLISEEELEGA